MLKKKFNIYSRLLNKRSLNNHTHNQNKSGNKNGNLNNFRSLIFNKSLDNGYRKDRYKEMNNYYNFKKFNNIKEIKKKIYRTIETKRRTDNQNSYSPIITREINEQIQREFSSFENAVNESDLEMAENTSKELITLINKRNLQSKLNK